MSGSDFEVLSEAETGANDHEIIRANEIEAPALKISQGIFLKQTAVRGMTATANGNVMSES